MAISGAQGGRENGTKGSVTIEGQDVDIRHFVELTPTREGYRLVAGWSIPYKLDASGSGGNVISNAELRRSVIYQPFSVEAFFSVRIGAANIKDQMAQFLDNLATVKVFNNLTPGIHEDTRDLVDARINKVVNPAASTITSSNIEDPNTPNLI